VRRILGGMNGATGVVFNNDSPRTVCPQDFGYRLDDAPRQHGSEMAVDW